VCKRDPPHPPRLPPTPHPPTPKPNPSARQAIAGFVRGIYKAAAAFQQVDPTLPPIWQAVLKLDSAAVANAIRAGCDVNARTAAGDTPLLFMAREVGALRRLLTALPAQPPDAGVDVVFVAPARLLFAFPQPTHVHAAHSERPPALTTLPTQSPKPHPKTPTNPKPPQPTPKPQPRRATTSTPPQRSPTPSSRRAQTSKPRTLRGAPRWRWRC